MVAVLFIFARSVNSLPEPDFWWHLRNGQQIVQSHTIPGIDTYTFGAAGSPWLDHEWLSEAFLYLAFKAWAFRGIVALFFAQLAMIYAGIYYISFRAGADAISSLLVTVVAVMLGSVSFGPRPLLFGWLCLVVLLLLLQRFQDGLRGIWALPLLFAVWINCHGSWVFGLIVLALTIGSGLLEGMGTDCRIPMEQGSASNLAAGIRGICRRPFCKSLFLSTAALPIRSSAEASKQHEVRGRVAFGGLRQGQRKSSADHPAGSTGDVALLGSSLETRSSLARLLCSVDGPVACAHAVFYGAGSDAAHRHAAESFAARRPGE